MAKKRNCRRTQEEVEIHELAVKLRKMTDAQLVEVVRSASDKAADTAGSGNDTPDSIADFIEAFENANIPGIGKVTIKKLNTFAKENGYT